MQLIIKLKNSTGDTIIEVLIALAVLGVIISAGYSIATRSLNGVQVANERSEATKLAEGQLEAFKAYVDKAGGVSNLYSPANLADLKDITNDLPIVLNNDTDNTHAQADLLTFCFDSNGAVKRFNRGSVSLDNIDSANNPYPPDCKYNNRYNVAFDASKNIVKAADNSKTTDQYTFTIQVTWHKAGGGTSPEKVQLYEKANY